MKKTKTLMVVGLAALLGMGSSGGALAQEPIVSAGPGSTIVDEPPLLDGVGEEEVVTDLDFFLSAGYTLPNYNTYYRFRDEVVKEVAGPDYMKRTGAESFDPSTLVEIAAVYLTEGDFNDLLVFSHFPGDCDAHGCIGQIYKTDDGLKWNKVLEFKAYGMVYKPPTQDTRTEVVAVGGPDVPNVFYRWDGKAFRQFTK